MVHSYAEFQALQRTYPYQRAAEDGHVRIGLVQLASDFTLENEWRQLLGELERRLGPPVISSNQALFWHALQLAGCVHRPQGFGTLLTDSYALA